MKLVIVAQVGTTRHELDLKLAEMLNRYGIQGDLLCFAAGDWVS
jgi:hypothetical protein